MKLIIPITFFFLQVTIPSIHAQQPFESDSTQITDTLHITLQESMLMALENNPQLAVQRLDPKVQATYAREERAAFDPVLNADASRTESKSQRFLGAQRQPFNLTTTRTQYDAGISETLPTGTSINAQVIMSGSISNLYTDQYSGFMGVTVTQSLLQGFGTGYNLANLRIANLQTDISKWELKGVAESLVADVENAYWDLYLSSREIQIQQQSLMLAEQQLSETIERVAVGKLPELELASVRAEVSVRREALIDAQSHFEQARLLLLYLLNPLHKKGWNVVPLPLDQPFVPSDTLEPVKVHEELGLKYRPELRQAELAWKQGKLEITRTKNGLLPRLDLFISLSRTSYAQTFSTAYPDFQSPFSDVGVGLSFAFPIPNRAPRARLARAEYSRDQLEFSLLNMNRLVEWDVRSAYVEVLRSRQQIEVTRVTRELQEKNLAAEQEKFRVGKSTNLLVLQVQRDLTRSQLDEASAMVSYLNALVNLYVSEGTLLERRGIQAGYNP